MTNHPAVRRTLAAVAASAACLSLAACSDDEPADIDQQQDPALTAPGTTLGLGDTATLPIGDGVARVTVTRIETGNAADLRAFGKEPKAAVSYVWVEVAPLSGDVAAFASYRSIHGWSGDDLVPHVLTDPRPYAPCPTRYFPDVTASGALGTCVVFTNATPIDRVGFHDQGDYLRNDAEVIWE